MFQFCGLDNSTGRAANWCPEGASSNPVRVNIFQLTSAVSDYREKFLFAWYYQRVLCSLVLCWCVEPISLRALSNLYVNRNRKSTAMEINLKVVRYNILRRVTETDVVGQRCRDVKCSVTIVVWALLHILLYYTIVLPGVLNVVSMVQFLSSICQ